ncbi:hypothetical protein Lser_V15G34944 [Lactuca serriola]
MFKARNVQDKEYDRKQNHDDASASTKKRFYEKGYSDLNHDILFLIMMQLGIVDFIWFSGVCKSWRSLALSNWKMFMASRLPVSMRITYRPYEKKEWYLELEESEGRKFKTFIPHSDGGRTFFGSTRGYLVFFVWKTRDFWLVNPITRHELHFPDHPLIVYFSRPTGLKAILVFSPSDTVVSEWVLVVSKRFCDSIWFSVAGSRSWTEVNVPSITSAIYDLHFFKEKIYVLFSCSLYVLQLYPNPKFTLLQTNNFQCSCYWGEFVSTAANLYVMINLDWLHKLDFDEMKWVRCEKVDEHADVKLGIWANIWSMWYFPHDFLNVNLLHHKP